MSRDRELARLRKEMDQVFADLDDGWTDGRTFVIKCQPVEPLPELGLLRTKPTQRDTWNGGRKRSKYT